MSYDRAKLEQAIRAGEPLPGELLDILKKNAADRRSAKIDARLQKVTQQLRDLAQAGKSSPLTPSQKRFLRSHHAFPPSRSYISPAPAPAPLACMTGWKTVGDTSAPFSWGSQETAQLGPEIPDGSGVHQWSVMTRQQTGEFSLALAVDSDPDSAYSPTTNEGLTFKGVTLSATIGQVYSVTGNPLVLQGQARLAMNEFLSDACVMRVGDAFAVTAGSATLTLSQYAFDFTGVNGSFPAKLLAQSSTEASLFALGAEPYATAFFENNANFDGSPFDLSATLPNNSDATFTEIAVDIQLFAAVTPGIPDGYDSVLIYFDLRVDDDDLIVGPESDNISPGHPWPSPCPILLQEARLCSYTYDPQ